MLIGQGGRRRGLVANFGIFTALLTRRAMLPERRTGAMLGDRQLRSHLLNAGTATRGA